MDELDLYVYASFLLIYVELCCMFIIPVFLSTLVITYKVTYQFFILHLHHQLSLESVKNTRLGHTTFWPKIYFLSTFYAM